MPQPTASQVHVDAVLTNVSIAYMQDHAGYLAERLFPRVPVQKQSNVYFKYDKGYWFRDEAKKRAPGTESAGGGYGVSTDNYFCEPYAFHTDVDPQIRANTDQPLDADIDATQYVTEKLLLKREKLVLASYFTTGVWTGSTTGGDITPGTKWSAVNSTPVEDVTGQIWHVKGVTGKFPNRLCFGALAWSNGIQNHAEILDRIKYTQKGVVTPELFASLVAPPDTPDFQVLVASAIENTAKEGAADSFSWMASSKDALLVYAEPNPGLRKPSGGYIFAWSGFLGQNAFGAATARIPMPWLGISESAGVTERIEGQIALDAKLVGADLGAYFSAAVA